MKRNLPSGSVCTHKTKIIHINSEPLDALEIRFGVPQGLKLGPLLFLAFTNVMVDRINSRVKLFY